MKWLEKLKNLFHKKNAEATDSRTQAPGRIRKTCKNCGKSFSVDPSWEHIPNYCKECKQKFAREKEERQRAGAKKKITRKCKNCGKFFTFPSNLPHYPNYCNNCRKQHQAEMKAKYGRPVNRKKNEENPQNMEKKG